MVQPRWCKHQWDNEKHGYNPFCNTITKKHCTSVLPVHYCSLYIITLPWCRHLQNPKCLQDSWIEENIISFSCINNTLSGTGNSNYFLLSIKLSLDKRYCSCYMIFKPKPYWILKKNVDIKCLEVGRFDSTLLVKKIHWLWMHNVRKGTDLQPAVLRSRNEFHCPQK